MVKQTFTFILFCIVSWAEEVATSKDSIIYLICQMESSFQVIKSCFEQQLKKENFIAWLWLNYTILKSFEKSVFKVIFLTISFYKNCKILELKLDVMDTRRQKPDGHPDMLIKILMQILSYLSLTLARLLL